MLHLAGMFWRNNHIGFHYISSNHFPLNSWVCFSVFFSYTISILYVSMQCLSVKNYSWERKWISNSELPRSTDPNPQMIALKCTFYFQIWDITIQSFNDSNVMYFGTISLASLFKMVQTIKIMRKQTINYLMTLL